MYKQILLKPRVSEKSYESSQNGNVYVFTVPKDANKIIIGRAVAAQFNVTVEDVRIAHLPPKPKRSVRQGGRKVSKGMQPGIKKAYVKLKDGDSIPIFAAEEEEKAREEKINQQLQRSKK
jgi:ribosomal protein L23